MKKILLWILVSAPSLLLAQQYAIVDVRVSGTERFKPAEVVRASGLSPNKNKQVSLDQVKEAAQKLVNSGVFKEVSYRHTAAAGGMKVEFTVKDNDDEQFVPADFENIVWFTQAELTDELHKRVPLFNGQVSLSGNIADELSAAISTLLETKGVKTHVSAMPVTENSHPGAPDYVAFSADEINVNIGRVDLPGASPEFVSALQAEAKKLIGVSYHHSTVRNFADFNLRNIYLKQGFLQAKFSDPVPAVLSNDADTTNVAVTIPVTQGRPYVLSQLRWSGNKAMTEAQMQKFVADMVPGKTVDGLRFNRDLEQLRYHYAETGYLHMTLDSKPTFDDGAGNVGYDVQIKEGDLYTMGKLEVEGLTPSSAEQIRNAWKLREGDPFDLAYLRKFFGSLRLPEGVSYLVEQSEGERPKSLDVTMVFCKQACKPTANTLYVPEKEKQENHNQEKP